MFLDRLFYRIKHEKTEVINVESFKELIERSGFKFEPGEFENLIKWYFKNKEEIHIALLTGLLDVWLAPLRAIRADGDPATEIGSYIRRKLESSREYPRESRLFANEILAGAPHIGDFLQSELRQLVDEKADILQSWIDDGRLAPCDPRHLLFAIWSTTQHYADFSVQVRHVLRLAPGDKSYYAEAARMLDTLFLGRLVAPGTDS